MRSTDISGGRSCLGSDCGGPRGQPGDLHPPLAGEALRNRRAFLADVGMGFTGLVLGKMLADEGIVRAGEAKVWLPPDGRPDFQPRAKSIIWIFLVGGMSQMETFDPKPELNKWAGKTFDESPYKSYLDSPYLKKNLREVIAGLHHVHPKIYEMQVTYRKWGQSGLEISDWWPEVAACADDLAIVRSCYHEGFTHSQAQFLINNGWPRIGRPSMGSWILYGLGSESIRRSVIRSRSSIA